MARKVMRWLDAIERVLEESDQPLHSAEIAEIAIRSGLVKKRSEFPDHTVQAAVLRHIKSGNAKGFLMVGEGRRERYYWLERKRINGKR